VTPLQSKAHLLHEESVNYVLDWFSAPLEGGFSRLIKMQYSHG
jgi:hypothetical protein